MDRVRIDKWLWSVRIFKTRSIATDACKRNHVSINDEPVKASYLVQRDEIVHVRKDGYNLQFKVIDLIEKRVSAPLAQACYDNITPEDELNKFEDWYIGKSGREARERGTGRPTKKERRVLDEFKGERFEE